MKEIYKTVALLPMKGHSERVPNKNFRQLNGKPLFCWILDALLEIQEIERVVINTDVPERVEHDLHLTTHDRVSIVARSLENCGDYVSMNKIIEEDISNFPAEVYAMTHATNPLLTSTSIQSAIKLHVGNFEDNSYDSLFTVTRHQTRFYDSQARPLNHNPKYLERTQDLDPYFEENSCLYIFSGESFARANNRIGERPFMYEISKTESIDIDTQQDWDLAQLVQRGILEDTE